MSGECGDDTRAVVLFITISAWWRRSARRLMPPKEENTTEQARSRGNRRGPALSFVLTSDSCSYGAASAGFS